MGIVGLQTRRHKAFRVRQVIGPWEVLVFVLFLMWVSYPAFAIYLHIKRKYIRQVLIPAWKGE